MTLSEDGDGLYEIYNNVSYGQNESMVIHWFECGEKCNI